MRSISASVGQGGHNHKSDVVTVQELLNKVPTNEGGPLNPLKVDGLAWDKTIAAIKRFQSLNLGHKWPDGRVDANGKSLARLNDYDKPEPPAQPQYVYMVGGHKPVIAQCGFKTCWAAVYAMMRSWREGKTFAIEEALEKPGKRYVDLFKEGCKNPIGYAGTLPPSQMREFWTRGGLTVRGMAAAFPPYIWHDLLIHHGLLAVGTSSSLPPLLGLHLRVMEGMSCFGTPSDCYYIIDSAFGGKKYPERSFDFESKYNYAISIGGGTHWQIAHYW